MELNDSTVNSTLTLLEFFLNSSTSDNFENIWQRNLSVPTSNTSIQITRKLHVYGLPFPILFGTIGNLLILFVMQKEPLKKSSICFYMSVLSVADTGKCGFFQYLSHIKANDLL